MGSSPSYNKLEITGVVRPRHGRGTELGFPTANLVVAHTLEEGIYCARTTIEGGGEGLPSLLFVGAAKTFGETEQLCEVYILDFREELYGKTLRVEVLKKLRGNKKFDSAEALVAQMRDDERQAREYFNLSS